MQIRRWDENSTDSKALSWTFTPVPQTKDTLDKGTDGPYLGWTNPNLSPACYARVMAILSFTEGQCTQHTPTHFWEILEKWQRTWMWDNQVGWQWRLDCYCHHWWHMHSHYRRLVHEGGIHWKTVCCLGARVHTREGVSMVFLSRSKPQCL